MPSSGNWHAGWSHLFTIVTSIAISTVCGMLTWSLYMSGSGTAGSFGSVNFSFFFLEFLY